MRKDLIIIIWSFLELSKLKKNAMNTNLSKPDRKNKDWKFLKLEVIISNTIAINRKFKCLEL